VRDLVCHRVDGGGGDMTQQTFAILRPERTRNIVPPPMLPDEMSRANAERRKARTIARGWLCPCGRAGNHCAVCGWCGAGTRKGGRHE